MSHENNNNNIPVLQNIFTMMFRIFQGNRNRPIQLDNLVSLYCSPVKNISSRDLFSPLQSMKNIYFQIECIHFLVCRIKWNQCHLYFFLQIQDYIFISFENNNCIERDMWIDIYMDIINVIYEYLNPMDILLLILHSWYFLWRCSILGAFTGKAVFFDFWWG